MAGGLDVCKVDGKLYPAAASLQNCLRFSNNCQYLSILCDFGFTVILKVNGTKSPSPDGVVHKTLKHDNESLEGHTWSSDDELYAVISQKVYIYMVKKDFSLLHVLDLYYIPKDIAIATESADIQHNNENAVQTYKTAIAGPNGVEIYHLALDNTQITMKEGIHLHNDLAIVLVDFSPNLQYLAVAALDCHFGIWNVQSLEGEHRDFWYNHLSTIRITGMRFSDDNLNIAVSGWDGACYVFTKVSQSSEWSQCSYKLQSAGERICGILTGSLVCWSPCSKTVRFQMFISQEGDVDIKKKLSFANEEGSWLSTTNPPNEKLSTRKVAEKRIEIKGLDSFRCPSGAFSMCFLNSKELVMTGWPD